MLFVIFHFNLYVFRYKLIVSADLVEPNICVGFK